jgi:hypothetical protein
MNRIRIAVVAACLCCLAACRALDTSERTQAEPGGVSEKEILTQAADEWYRDELVRIASEENKRRDAMEELGATEAAQEEATSQFTQQRATARRRWIEQRKDIKARFDCGKNLR